MNDDVGPAAAACTAYLWWIWGRPGPAGGWQLLLPARPDLFEGGPAGQVLRPPRRGMRPQEVEAWLSQMLTRHGWQPHPSLTWPPLTAIPAPSWLAIPLLPLTV